MCIERVFLITLNTGIFLHTKNDQQQPMGPFFCSKMETIFFAYKKWACTGICMCARTPSHLVCSCMYMYCVHMHAYMCSHARMHVYVCMRTYIHVHVCVHMQCVNLCRFTQACTPPPPPPPPRSACQVLPSSFNFVWVYTPYTYQVCMCCMSILSLSLSLSLSLYLSQVLSPLTK
jgi:hypothetical protein